MREESKGLVSCQDFLDRLEGVGGATASPCMMKGTMGICIRVPAPDVAQAERVLRQHRFLVPYEIWPHGVSRWTGE